MSEHTATPKTGTIQVGRYYSVPHVFGKYGIFKDLWVPVFGTLHEDREHINFPHHHWHIDWRFASRRLWHLAEGRFATVNRSPVEILKKILTVDYAAALDIVPKVRKCRRPMPLWPSHGKYEPVFWLPSLEAAFTGQRLNCGRCPHRALDLTHLPADANGIVVCPGHGLAWHQPTGQLHPRTIPASDLPAPCA